MQIRKIRDTSAATINFNTVGSAQLELRSNRDVRETYTVYSAKQIKTKGKIMVKHIILWQLKDGLSAEEKESVKKGIKAGLEGLVGKVPGLREAHVYINGLPSSNADVMLDTTLDDEASLKGYSVHPEHLAVANGKVRPYTKTRTCMDFEI